MWTGLSVRRGRLAWEKGSAAFAAGRLADAEGAFHAALRHVRDASAGDPQLVEVAARAYGSLGRIRLRRDDILGAEAAFGEAFRRGLADAESLYWAGCAASHRADFERADHLFSQSLATDPGYAKAYRQRAFVRVRLGRSVQALGDLDAADRTIGLDPDARLVQAFLLTRERRWRQAEAAATAAAGTLHDARAAALAGYAAYRGGKPVEGLTLLGHAIQRGYVDDTVLLHYGLVAYSLGRYDVSHSSWQTLCDRYPGSQRYDKLLNAARLGSARDLAHRQRFADAADRLTHLAPGHPALGDLRLRAAAVAIADGSDESRARSQLAACDPLPRDDFRKLRLAAVLATTGADRASAAALWKSLLGQRQRDWLALLGFSIATSRAGEAMDVFDECLRDARDAEQEAAWERTAQAVATLCVRRRDWVRTLTVIDIAGLAEGEWSGIHAEALYRTGKFAELSALPDRPERSSWKALAWLRLGAPADLDAEDRAARTIAAVDAVANDPRTSAELEPLLHSAIAARAEQEDWSGAAELLAQFERLSLVSEIDEIAEALVFVLGGKRRQAFAVLDQACRDEPADPEAAHARALLLLHTLSESGADGAAEADRADVSQSTKTWATWKSVIAAWGRMVSDEDYQDEWLSKAERRFGEPITEQTADAFRAALGDLLEQRISKAASDDPSLPNLWSREILAATKLGEYGGFPLSDNLGRPYDFVVCGPLGVAELGLHHEFGAFAADEQADDPTADELVSLFSNLGLAESRASAGHWTDVVDLALDTRCPRCRAKAGTDGRTTADANANANSTATTCRADCATFAADNPGLSALSVGQARDYLRTQGSSLAALALTEIAEAAAAASPPDLVELQDRWTQAVRCGAAAGIASLVEERISRTALGRSAALNRARKWDVEADLLGIAMDCLETADEDVAVPVANRLAEALTNRSITALNEAAAGGGRPSLADLAAVLVDLRRAEKLSPHVAWVSITFVQALAATAMLRLRTADFEGALLALAEAQTVVHRGLEFHPTDKELLGEQMNVQRLIARIFGGR